MYHNKTMPQLSIATTNFIPLLKLSQQLTGKHYVDISLLCEVYWPGYFSNISGMGIMLFWGSSLEKSYPCTFYT